MTAKTAIIGQGGIDEPVQYWFDFNHLGVVGRKTTDNAQCNAFPILDNDPGCEQEDGSKTAGSGGTQYNTFPILEDNPVGEQDTDPVCEQEDGSKTLFLGGTQGPVHDPGCEQEDGSKTSFLGGTQGKDPVCEQEDGSKTLFFICFQFFFLTWT